MVCCLVLSWKCVGEWDDMLCGCLFKWKYLFVVLWMWRLLSSSERLKSSAASSRCVFVW